MSSDSFQTRFSRSLGRNALKATHLIIRNLPYPVYRAMTFVFMAIGQLALHSKKRLALENMRMAFGEEKSEQEVRELAQKAFDNFGLGMIELVYFLDKPKEVVKRVTIQGKENLDAALAKGNGVVLLSAHFGNFVLMMMRLAAEGYKVNCIMRQMRDEEFEKYILDLRNRNGIHTIHSQPRRDCIVHSLRCLKENEALFILLDQHYGDDGRVFVDFFGQPAATATGPVIFSQRAGAPILPAFITRDGKDRFKIHIDPPVILEAPQGSEEDTTRNVAQLSKVIESYVRRYPEEWGGWLHRRWKSKETQVS